MAEKKKSLDKIQEELLVRLGPVWKTAEEKPEARKPDKSELRRFKYAA